MFFNPDDWVFQRSMTHNQVNQDVHEGPQDQDPVLARPIIRPKPVWLIFLSIVVVDRGKKKVKILLYYSVTGKILMGLTVDGLAW